MKKIKTFMLCIIGGATFFLPAFVSWGLLTIESYAPGRITWSGATPGTTNRIEWTANLESNGWVLLTNVIADSSVMSAAVPFVYRINERQPTNLPPSSYDLRDYNWITPVRSQAGNYPSGYPDPGDTVGICWAMSAMAVFESSLLKQGITTDPDNPHSSFSPWHLGNAVGQPPLQYNTPCYNYYPDILEIPLFASAPPTTYGYLSPEGTNGWGGGHVFWLLDYLLTWTGPVYEAGASVPIDEMTAHQTLQWSNRNAAVTDYIVRGVYRFLPDDYATIAEYRMAAKQAILDFGAIQTYMLLLPGDLPDIDGLTFYNTNSACIYCPRANLVQHLNHAIAIIGWDDAFVVDTAPAPGAWLIKESLGTNCYDKGCHWIAYEDQTFLQGAADFMAVDAANRSPYQWPGLLTHPGALTRFDMMSTDFLGTGSSMWGQDSQCYAHFDSGSGGQLTAVGLVTLNRDEEVTIAVYQDVDAQLNPTNLLTSMQTSLSQRGYHLIDLETPLDISSATNFYISLNFAYHDQDEPIVYCSDSNQPPAATWVLQYNATNTEPEWVSMTDIDPNGSVFIQAVYTE